MSWTISTKMSGRKTIVLSGDGSDVVFTMWTKYKEKTGDTSVQALKKLLQTMMDTSEAASNTAVLQESPIKVTVEETQKPTLEECVKQEFFLGTVKSVQELSMIFHNHARVCLGQPKLVPSTNRTYTSCELFISCGTCSLKVLWQSSPSVGTSPLSDHRVGVGLHLAGINPAKVKRFLHSLGMELWQPHIQSSSDTILNEVVEQLTEDSCNQALSLEEKELGLSFDARYQQRTDANNTTVVFVSPLTHKICVVVNISKADDRCDLFIHMLLFTSQLIIAIFYLFSITQNHEELGFRKGCAILVYKGYKMIFLGIGTFHRISCFIIFLLFFLFSRLFYTHHKHSQGNLIGVNNSSGLLAWTEISS